MNVFLFKNTNNGSSILDKCPFFRMVIFFSSKWLFQWELPCSFHLISMPTSLNVSIPERRRVLVPAGKLKKLQCREVLGSEAFGMSKK